MARKSDKQVGLARRRRRIRRKVVGSPDQPRLAVRRSLKHIYAQIVDDDGRRTMMAASTMEGPVRQKLPKGGGNRLAAQIVGEALAAKAVEAGIKKVVFDRNGYPFHGRVRALADAVRKGGLEF